MMNFKTRAGDMVSLQPSWLAAAREAGRSGDRYYRLLTSKGTFFDVRSTEVYEQALKHLGRQPDFVPLGTGGIRATKAKSIMRGDGTTVCRIDLKGDFFLTEDQAAVSRIEEIMATKGGEK